MRVLFVVTTAGMKGVLGKAKRKLLGGSSSRQASSSPSVEMVSSHSDDPMEDESYEPQLVTLDDVELRGDREGQAFNMLRNRFFSHTRIFDPDLLQATD